MINLYDNDTGAALGTISEAQLGVLQSNLEEESFEDQDYYIAAVVVDMIEARGGDPDLVALLRKALAGHEGVEIRWEQV